MMSNLRTTLIRELGITVLWQLRRASQDTADTDTGKSEPNPLPKAIGHFVEQYASSAPARNAENVAPTKRETVSDAAAQNTTKKPRRITWPGETQVRQSQNTSALAASPPVSVDQTSPDIRKQQINEMGWEALEHDIRQCSACRLCENRRQAVPGVGDRTASWLFVGEAPGAEEDRKGEPFVGPAGKLLDKMLASIALTRSQDVYIANAVKCRPPSNRTPQNDEIALCGHYLDRQIALVQPRLIVALGRPAALSLLGADVKINEVRGSVQERQGIPVVVTYHPSYLLRQPAEKGKAWQDLCFALDVMRRQTEHD